MCKRLWLFKLDICVGFWNFWQWSSSTPKMVKINPKRKLGTQSLADTVVEIQCFSKAEQNTKQRFKEERQQGINKTMRSRRVHTSYLLVRFPHCVAIWKHERNYFQNGKQSGKWVWQLGFSFDLNRIRFTLFKACKVDLRKGGGVVDLLCDSQAQFRIPN